MADDIVARARAALEGITPGPWRYCRGSNSDPAIMIDVDAWVSGGGLRVAVEDMMEEDEVDPCDIKGWIRDAEFIAQSPELVAKLVAEVERLRDVKAEWRMYCIRAESERDQLKAAVERVQQMHSTKWECGNPRHTNPDGVCPECFVVCVTCDRTMPCPTVRELDRIDKELGL